MPPPSWLSLLSPLPSDVTPERKPVASAEQIEQGTAGPIAGWTSININLSEPEYGLRHLLVVLDAEGGLLAGSDHVMFVRETAPESLEPLVTDHESIGGRFEADGSFRGTCWKSRVENVAGGDDEDARHASEQSTPTDDQVAALRRLIDDVLRREGR
jgi:hypothetical protein